MLSLNVGLDDQSEDAFPFVWLVAKSLSLIWTSRMEKKMRSKITTRATLEAEIMLLRKTRNHAYATKLKRAIEAE